MEWNISTSLLAALVPFTVVAVDILRRVIQQRVERQGHTLPPGPAALPLIGSAFAVNPKRPWLTYTEWQKIYGDIIFVRLLGTDIVVLNSTSISTELVEKRSRIYSDRPVIPTLVPYGNDCNFAFIPYGDHWRLCRRIFQQTFNSNASINFKPMQLRRARQLVCNITDDPADYPFHFQTFSGAVAMSAVYDYEPNARNDPMISIIENYLRRAVPGLAPWRALLIGFLPFLLRVPEWLPGSLFRREAKEAYEWKNKVMKIPYQYVLDHMKSDGHVNFGMVSDHVTRMGNINSSDRSEYETALMHASVTAFIGSVETTTSTLLTFLLAMVENPHVWKRAQAEIDATVGTERLPEFEDKPTLPFVEAIVRETMRWIPVTPLLLPHATTSSDIYNGYYIPKGATVLVNAWAISRDETRYPNAEKFMPERFLNADGKLIDNDPRDFIFGFGRRKCPGRHAADASTWSAIVTMLATLDFNRAKDANGNEIMFEATLASGVTEHPDPFPCRITLRAHFCKEMLDRVLTKE